MLEILIKMQANILHLIFETSKEADNKKNIKSEEQK
jgi:hypothetical protein